jgi:hypothetical protein
LDVILTSSGKYTINPLEPKAWNDGTDDIDPEAPVAFRKVYKTFSTNCFP